MLIRYGAVMAGPRRALTRRWLSRGLASSFEKKGARPCVVRCIELRLAVVRRRLRDLAEQNIMRYGRIGVLQQNTGPGQKEIDAKGKAGLYREAGSQHTLG